MSEKKTRKNKKNSRSLQDMCDNIDNASIASGGSGTSSRSSSRGVYKRRPTLDMQKMKQGDHMPSFEAHRANGSFFCGDGKTSRLTEGVNVLSWDCGISNLCYCLLEEVDDGHEFRVKMWENFSLNSQTLKQATTMLVRELDQRPWMMDVDYICIENQVLKNTSMKVICHNIQCYFETRNAARSRKNAIYTNLSNGVRIARKGKEGPSINFIKADSKFLVATNDPAKHRQNPCIDHIVIPNSIEKLQRRRRNKKAAVFLAKEILTRRNDITALNFLNSYNKQDDLSDSLLQGLYFLRTVKQKREHTTKLHKFLGMTSLNTISIDTMKTKTGTRDEPYDDTDGLNEGCEYEKEILLPQVYRSPKFNLPDYDTTQADISMITRFVRSSEKN
jgi:hypothetical protein